MINIRTIKKLADGDGLTLKNGKIKRYKSGYQVATNGVEVISPEWQYRRFESSKAHAAFGLKMADTTLTFLNESAQNARQLKLAGNVINFQFTDGVGIPPVFTFNSIWGWKSAPFSSIFWK